MHDKSARATRVLARPTWVVLALMLAATVLLGATAASASAASGESVWLCRPGQAKDPCKTSRTATVVTYEGSTRQEVVQKPVRTGKSPIDCFYVYPTVSEQTGPNANLEIEPQERHIAIDQASRFSQDCRVFAPMYPQLTLSAIGNPGGITKEEEITAYLGVLEPWLEYLEKYNEGRGFVLIGHSQGALLLEQLIKEQIDPNPALRKQLVSAILLGGNVLVPEGKRVGGTFKNVPACQSAIETSCVIAYSSFLKEPPEGSYFGRPNSPLLNPGETVPEGMQVLCVNPTLLTQGSAAGPLLPYASTKPFPGALGAFSPAPSASTPWVTTPDLYEARCKHENGASWLQVSIAGSPSEEVLKAREEDHEIVQELLGPDWGLHLYDVNLALGNLVKTVAIQAQAYAFDN
jgi:hypothetical protein